MYRATARRDGRWWFVQVPGDQGLYTQVRRLDQAEAMMREVISLVRHVSEDSFDVTIEPDSASLGDLRAAIKAALEAREAAAQAQDQASEAMRHAVREIRNSGYTSRDAGMLLGVSNQRISQIERQATESRSRGPRRATIGEVVS
jgi:DNA-directed RNA polymerase specialized sigma subunit